MPFRSTNAPASSQAYIDDFLSPYIDGFAICYLDDILIYSTNQKEHTDHLQIVIKKLFQFVLCCKTEKFQHEASKIGFLG